MVPKNYFSPKSKTGLFKILKDFKDKDVIAMHGCKQSDECFIDIKNKITELHYLDYKNIKYFWGEDENYKKEFCNYLKEL